MNYQIKDVGLVVLGILMFISVLLSLQKVDQYIKFKGYDDCAKISRSETTAQNGDKVFYPLEDVYKNCLKDKGITQ